ncbi:MAG: HTH domain-containing protein [Burkholderiales bacterium]
MDALITAAARALAGGDLLGALQRVSLRDDPPALALRGIAMAQLGEHLRARELLRRAARGFGAHEALARARCVVAEAEVALALRDLRGSSRPLLAAAAALEARADVANALHARLIAVRRELLLGRLAEAEGALATLVTQADLPGMPPALQAVAALTAAELALRSLRIDTAASALARAEAAAAQARIPALQAEVADARALLAQPAARQLQAGREQPLRLADVATLLGSGTLVLDACRHALRATGTELPLARRPVLFALARALAEAWPGEVDRHALIAQAFRTQRPDETHRARLRVEIGRLRALVAPLARIEASARGFVLSPRAACEVVVLLPPIDGEQAALQALLADGAAWSTSALALALNASQRTVQRALAELEAAGRVRSIGQARAQRWLAPPLIGARTGFTTILLLPAALPSA